MFGSRLLDTSPGRRSALSDLLEVSGRYEARPAHLRDTDGVGTSESGHGNYVSLAELAMQLKVPLRARSTREAEPGFVGAETRDAPGFGRVDFA